MSTATVSFSRVGSTLWCTTSFPLSPGLLKLREVFRKTKGILYYADLDTYKFWVLEDYTPSDINGKELVLRVLKETYGIEVQPIN